MQLYLRLVGGIREVFSRICPTGVNTCSGTILMLCISRRMCLTIFSIQCLTFQGKLRTRTSQEMS